MHNTGFPSNTSRAGWATDKLHAIKGRVDSRYLPYFKGIHLFREPLQAARFLRMDAAADHQAARVVVAAPGDLLQDQMAWVCSSFHRFESARFPATPQPV